MILSGLVLPHEFLSFFCLWLDPFRKTHINTYAVIYKYAVSICKMGEKGRKYFLFWWEFFVKFVAWFFHVVVCVQEPFQFKKSIFLHSWFFDMHKKIFYPTEKICNAQSSYASLLRAVLCRVLFFQTSQEKRMKWIDMSMDMGNMYINFEGNEIEWNTDTDT